MLETAALPLHQAQIGLECTVTVFKEQLSGGRGVPFLARSWVSEEDAVGADRQQQSRRGTPSGFIKALICQVSSDCHQPVQMASQAHSSSPRARGDEDAGSHLSVKRLGQVNAAYPGARR